MMSGVRASSIRMLSTSSMTQKLKGVSARSTSSAADCGWLAQHKGEEVAALLDLGGWGGAGAPPPSGCYCAGGRERFKPHPSQVVPQVVKAQLAVGDVRHVISVRLAPRIRRHVRLDEAHL